MSTKAEDLLQARLDGILAGKEAMEITLYEESGLPIGVMRPLTARHLDQTDVLEKLTNWRSANMEMFLTHFEATLARTRVWLQNVLLKEPGQMLWLIFDQEGTLIGHFGFKNLTENSALLDNAIRGERHGHPKLFIFAGRALVEWLWNNTSICRIEGVVMAENVSAIMMNLQIGFQGWKRHPLIKRIVGGDTHWNIGREGLKSPEGRYCFTLFIERDGDASTPT